MPLASVTSRDCARSASVSVPGGHVVQRMPVRSRPVGAAGLCASRTAARAPSLRTAPPAHQSALPGGRTHPRRRTQPPSCPARAIQRPRRRDRQQEPSRGHLPARRPGRPGTTRKAGPDTRKIIRNLSPNTAIYAAPEITNRTSCRDFPVTRSALARALRTHRGPVLVIVEDRDVKDFPQLAFPLEAARCRHVFQAHAAGPGRDRADTAHHLRHLADIQAQRPRVDPGEPLVQCGLDFQHRQSGARPDVAQAGRAPDHGAFYRPVGRPHNESGLYLGRKPAALRALRAAIARITA